MNLKHKNETGRSMVEMLGTLAIIGVLSIGGVAGYSYAMDKYNASEIVNGVRLRATDLMAQALQNNEILSLEGWNEKTVYPILNADYATDGSVMLEVGTQANPIPKRICEMVFDDLFPYTVQIDINNARAVSKEACSNDNVVTFYFNRKGNGPAVCEPVCSGGEVCDNGECYKASKVEKYPSVGTTCETDADCNAGYAGNCAKCSNNICRVDTNYEGSACTLNDSTIGQCAQGTCQSKSGCTYTENICTGKNEYCASPNTSQYEAFPNGETGVCVTADIVRYEFNGRVYFISNPGLSWWDARAFCDMLGLDFVPKEELYQNGKRTELTKQFFKFFGYTMDGIWGHDYNGCGAGTADILTVWQDNDSCWIKSERGSGGGFAVCR